MEATKNGTLSDAIALVSTADIIDTFEIPSKTRRGRTYLLCPGHDDQHFGSCYVDKKDDGYYCYVCGKHVRKWDMVVQLCGGNGSVAREWFFKMSGLSPTEERRDDPYKRVITLIRRLEKHINNKVVHNDLYACEKVESSYGRYVGGEYVYSELAVTNPLLNLYKTDKDAFKHVVRKALKAKMTKFEKKQNLLTNDKNGFYLDNIGLFAGNEVSDACQPLIDELQSLIIEVDSL